MTRTSDAQMTDRKRLHTSILACRTAPPSASTLTPVCIHTAMGSHERLIQNCPEVRKTGPGPGAPRRTRHINGRSTDRRDMHHCSPCRPSLVPRTDRRQCALPPAEGRSHSVARSLSPPGADRLIHGSSMSQDREREAVHTALLCMARRYPWLAPRWSAPDTSTRWRTPAYWGLVRDGACSITAVAGRHPLAGAPVDLGRRRGGGVTNVVEAAAHNSSAQAAAGAAEQCGPQFRGMCWVCPRPRRGQTRLRCPGERNGACRWLKPVRESSDAPIRAVRMSHGRGRRGRQRRGTACCRTR